MKNVRPLTLALKRCSVGWDTRPQWLLWETLTVNTIVQCAADLSQRRQAAAMQMSGHAQSLPVLSVLSDVRLRFTLRQLHSGNIPVAQIAPEYQKTELLYRAAKPVVTVDAVTFGVGTKYARARLFDRVNTLRALGALLRLNYFSGFPDDTTRSLELLANSFSHQVFGATLSVVPHAIKSLTHVLCTSVGLQEKLLQLAWLAYALYHPRRQMRCLESVEIYLPITALNRSEVQYVEEIIRSGMPLRDVVGVALFNRYGRPRTPIQVDCFSLGVVVSIPQGTLLYYEPGRRTAQYLVATLERTVQVEVVAQLPADGFLGVVYPGFGLVWVDQAVVTWMAATAEYPSTDGAASATIGSLLTTTQLQLQFYKFTPPRNSPPNFSTPISPLRLFLGSQLRTLAVLDYSPLTREDLELILMSCPCLWRLEIRQCTIESLWPLLDAYFAEPPSQCRVSSLRLASDGNAAERSSSSSSRSQPVVVTPVDLFGPLMEALCDATHPLTLTLRDLNVDLRETPCEDTNVRHLIRALRGNTTKLERLVVKSAAASTAHVARELGRFRDQVLVNGSAMRLAFMGVLRRCGIWGGRVEANNARVLSEESVRTVFAFTGSSVVRRVSWTSKKRTRSP